MNNCKIELIETKPCKNKDELSKLEGHYIRSLECVNKYIPGRTYKQYYNDNKDTIKQSVKLYNDENKKIISIRRKIIRQTKRINKTNTAYDTGAPTDVFNISYNRIYMVYQKYGFRPCLVAVIPGRCHENFTCGRSLRVHF